MSTIDPTHAIPGFIAVKPVIVPYKSKCKQCGLDNDERCFIAPCMARERPDGHNIIMKAINPSEETK